MPLGPWMLPGGMAMVPTVGGDPRFVIDADECCCPELECPSWPYCLANYADTYWFDIVTGDCKPPDNCICDGRYVLVRAPVNFCLWREWYLTDCDPPVAIECYGVLRCGIPPASIPLIPRPLSWLITIWGLGPPHRVCWYQKPLTPADMTPEGVYVYFRPFVIDADCLDCAPTITVYAGLPVTTTTL